tara:strand:- start:3246 stop:4232 length:987 start_codon:yes stop_codon:yes gene_type:complete
MKYKFTLDYLKSIPRDEFIHWTGVHVGPGTGKWGFNKGHIWNDKLQNFLNQHSSVIFISDEQRYNSNYMSRYFDDFDIIIATNDDSGILQVKNKYASGVNGVLIDNINEYLQKNEKSVNLEDKDLYVVTSPEPNGGTFPMICDIFNTPKNIKRIYSKGLMCTDNDKFRPLPNGLCNITIEPLRDKLLFEEEKRVDNLVVFNFRLGTNDERDKVIEYYKSKDWATEGTGRQFEYLREMYHHKFVISPESCCADSHRTWEAMYSGTIPIVQKTSGMSWFDDLPILQVDDICSLTKEYLEEKYDEMMNTEYNLDKLKISYWLNQIDEDVNV